MPPMQDWARVVHSASFRRLQGKTQVFPVHESDFFRNRITHSLEVAQIAEGIAQKLNYERDELQDCPINERVCIVAGLIHDLGHPPFGHNGERALDDHMRPYGGFEGNAQTLRIITRLEKKALRSQSSILDSGDMDEDERSGLSLSYRTILSALKYDRMIPHLRDDREKLVKGYYYTERLIVERAKQAVDPLWRQRKDFKTVECAIMDIADDIAYSTYDLEDSLKAGFLTPASILATDGAIFARVAEKANRSLPKEHQIDGSGALGIFLSLFDGLLDEVDKSKCPPDLVEFSKVYQASRNISEIGYDRTSFSSSLVSTAIDSIDFSFNAEAPWLSSVKLSLPVLKRVEVLKHFTYESTIYTARVKTGEHRGYDVVSDIFKALSNAKGSVLMPEDLRQQHRKFEHNATARMRAIADFIAGMTDRYALEFHARLYSDNPQSIFKPS
ncbi:dGTP triphosphohydrolase [Methylorubrum extorquens]